MYKNSLNMNNLFLIIVALLLLRSMVFFVRQSLVSLNCGRRAFAGLQDTGWRGRILAKVHSKLDAYLSACQLALRSLRWAWAGSANLHLHAYWSQYSAGSGLQRRN